MYVKYDTSLNDFEFWSGARETAKIIRDNGDMETIESILEGEYLDRDEIPTETEINDIFWFEEDFLAQCLGYDDWESYAYGNSDNDEEF